jgi:AraC-like DNA-binding protein
MNPVSYARTVSQNTFESSFLLPADESLAAPGHSLAVRLREVIEAHLDDSELCSGNLHRLVPTSRATLHRLLHKYTGLSTSSYLSRYRIQRSVYFLADCQRSIAEVAAKVGMNSSAYTRAFRAEFGYTPSDFRSQCWAHSTRAF